MNHKQAMRMAEEMLSKDEIDAIVYSCRRSDDDSTYSIVREAIAAALVKYTQGQDPVLSKAADKIEAATAGKPGPQAGFSITSQPKPVGYWVLYPNAPSQTSLAMYKCPTDEQIKNTEQLLGWGWREAPQTPREGFENGVRFAEAAHNIKEQQ